MRVAAFCGILVKNGIDSEAVWFPDDRFWNSTVVSFVPPPDGIVSVCPSDVLVSPGAQVGVTPNHGSNWADVVVVMAVPAIATEPVGSIVAPKIEFCTQVGVGGLPFVH